MRRKRYILTKRAAADLQEARGWSRAGWGKELTDQYFEDLHKGAQYIAEHHRSLRGRHDLAGGSDVISAKKAEVAPYSFTMTCRGTV